MVANRRPADGALGVIFSCDGLVSAAIDRVQGIDLNADIQKYRIPTVRSIVDQEGIALSA